MPSATGTHCNFGSAPFVASGGGRIDADILRDAYRASSAGDIGALIDANRRGVAFRATAETRLETTAQGEAFLATCRAAWPNPFLDRWAEGLSESGEAVCYAAAVGAATAQAGIALDCALLGYLQALASNLVSAGLRLGIIGQTDGQRILAALEPVISAAVAGALTRDPDGVRQRDLCRRARLDGSRNPIHQALSLMSNPLRLGIGGPVGSGKTALMDWLCKTMRGRYEIAAITNDIYTREDAEFLTRSGALPPERIRGVETGGCPHTAIREDASINLAAVAEMNRLFPDLDLILIESGGDNLAATFSPELADLTIYVIDVAAGDKIPRKGGPGITRSDLLVINKIDLAPLVGASLEIMDRDAQAHARRSPLRLHQPEDRGRRRPRPRFRRDPRWTELSGAPRLRAAAGPPLTRLAALRQRSPGKTRRSVRHSPSRRAKPNSTRPTGFAGVAPPGPAMPVTETARSTGARASAPCAIAAAVSALTAPCAAIVSGGTPSRLRLRLVRVGHKAPLDDVGGTHNRGQRSRDQPAGAGFRSRQPPIAGTAGVENRLREAQRFSFEHRMLHLAPTDQRTPEQRKPRPADRRA